MMETVLIHAAFREWLEKPLFGVRAEAGKNWRAMNPQLKCSTVRLGSAPGSASDFLRQDLDLSAALCVGVLRLEGQ